MKWIKMVHQSIKVFARLRKPCTDNCEQYDIIKKKKEYEDLVFVNKSTASSVHQCYRFHKVFNTNAAQPEVFETVAKPVICSVLEGFNGTIFAYGQTGSGKTFSINGSSKNYCDRGIIPRSIKYIFDNYINMPEKPTIYISYMEIYNEIGYDLLSTKQQNIAKTLEELPRVFVMEGKDGDSHIRNLSVFPVTTEEEAMRLLFMGDTNRTIAETPYNEYSSRSHCIFTLYITHRGGNSKNLRSSKLHLVDLAGSERVYKYNCTGVELHEAKFINLSLHFLQQVILALSESRRSHIPYRNSMLTHILKDSLNGNCITTMLATLSLKSENLQETISTCRFAQRVSLISTDPIINEITDPQQEIEMLKIRIQELESELSRSTDFTNSTSLTVQQKENCQFEVNSFVNSDKKSIALEADMTQIQFCFNLLKKDLNKKINELKTMERVIIKKNSEVECLNTEVTRKFKEIEKLKIIIDKIPENPVSLNLPHQDSVIFENCKHQTKKDEQQLLALEKERNFEEEEISQDLNFYKTALENKLNLAKLYAETIEECKIKITNIRNKLDSRHTNISEKENLIRRLEEQQKLYKQVLLEMKQIQSETNHLEAGLKQAEIRAVNKCIKWFPNKVYNWFSDENAEFHFPSPRSTIISNEEKPNDVLVSSFSTSKAELLPKKETKENLLHNLYDESQDIQPVKMVSAKNSIEIICNSKENPYFESCCIKTDLSVQNVLPKQEIFYEKSQPAEKLCSENSYECKKQTKSIYNNNINKNVTSNENIGFDMTDCVTSKPEDLVVTKESASKSLNIRATEVENECEISGNGFDDYFIDSDTSDFKEFMKTVTLSGVAEIDEEIVNFYRSKLC